MQKVELLLRFVAIFILKNSGCFVFYFLEGAAVKKFCAKFIHNGNEFLIVERHLGEILVVSAILELQLTVSPLFCSQIEILLRGTAAFDRMPWFCEYCSTTLELLD